jgi:hypothetical protein
LKKLFLLALLLSGCNKNDAVVSPTSAIEFGQPVRVNVQGYSGNMMEPFLTRDGSMMLFNNLNAAPENTNLHWATKINDSTFQYKGEIAGINTATLEGVATLDNLGNLYFVSNRDYATTLSTLYQCNFSNGTATHVQLIVGVSKLQAGLVNFDVEVSADGQYLYFVDAQFDAAGNPTSADLVIAEKKGVGFQRLANSSDITKNINTDDLEYAACISVDQLELYFTRLAIPITATSLSEIFICTRKDKNQPFGRASKIATLTGFVEAATIAPDQATIYFHKKDNNKFVLYKIKKK